MIVIKPLSWWEILKTEWPGLAVGPLIILLVLGWMAL